MTKDFERECLREILGPLRIMLGLRTRHKRERRRLMTVTGVRHDNYLERLKIAPEKIPKAAMLPCLEPPGIFAGRPPSSDFYSHVEWRFAPPDEINEILTQYQLKGVTLPDFLIHPFVRMLAKIAYAYAIAKYGLGSFDSFLIPIINGDLSSASYFVGGGQNPAKPIPTVHSIVMGRTNNLVGNPLRTLRLIVVRIRLFGNLGAPEFKVVAGEWIGSLDEIAPLH